MRAAGDSGVAVLAGSAAADSMRPFLVFSKAFEAERPDLFSEHEHVSFEQAMAVDRTGRLLASAGDGEFAGMLQAVQGFVRDSFGGEGALGRLEYGDFKILVENGEDLFLAVVFRGSEHPGMRPRLKAAAEKLEARFGAVIGAGGDVADVGPMARELAALASERFLVRRDFEGAKFESERLKVAERLLAALVDAAKPRPALLVLEDLHWADESSLFALGHVARNVGGMNVLVLCTSRPGEGQAFETALERMRSEGTVGEVPLGRLGAAEVAELARGLYPENDFSGDFLSRLAGKCSGNPLFVLETLRQMGDEGCIVAKGGVHTLAREDYAVPDTVEGAVERRLNSLDADAMAFAEYASCIGREFEVRAAMSLASMADPAVALGKLRAAGIVSASADSAEVAHALFRDVVYGKIDRRWKSAYHRSLGEHYEAGDRDAHAYELARHFSLTAEHAKAFAYCATAGEKAEGVYAAEQALCYYGDALGFAAKISAGDREGELIERMGDIHSLVSDFPAALERYVSAIPKTGAARRRADIHRKAANVLAKTGEGEKSTAEFEAGMALVEGEDCAERARLLLVQGWNLSSVGEYQRGQAFYDEGMALAKRLGLDKETALAHHNVGVSEWHRGDLDSAARHFAEAIAMRTRMGDLPGLGASTLNLGTVLHLKGSLDEAYERKMEALALYEKVGDKMGIATALNNIGIVFDDRGETDKSLEYYERSVAIRVRIGDRHGQATGFHNIGVAYNSKGDMKRAIESFEKGLAANRALGSKQGMVFSLCSLSEAYFEVGDFQRGEENAASALALAVEIGVRGEEGWARRNVARGLWKKAKWDEARTELDKALAIFEETGEKEEISKTFYELGNYWRDRGDAAKAREGYERAVAGFASIGSKKCESMAREALGKLA